METYPISQLIPDTITVYAGHADFRKKTNLPAPTYNPDLPNCYFSGSVAGLNKLEDNKLMPYGEQPKLNMPGPFEPILPLAGHGITVNGKPLVSPWYVTARAIADEIAGAVGYEVVPGSQMTLIDVRGANPDIDAFFVRILGTWINLGEVWSSKALYGAGSPGRWALLPDSSVIRWEPDTRVNPKTVSLPYRDLEPDEVLAVMPIGNPLVTRGAVEGGGPANGEILARLARIEGIVGNIQLLLSMRQ